MRVIICLLLTFKILLIEAQNDSCKDLGRQVRLTLDNKTIQLNNNFQIYLFQNNLKRIDLLAKENNVVNLPYRFPKDSIYNVVFIYKNYELTFDKVQGDNFNFDSDWDFNINTIGSNFSENNSWTFSPKDSDGWVIYAKSWYIRK